MARNAHGAYGILLANAKRSHYHWKDQHVKPANVSPAPPSRRPRCRGHRTRGAGHAAEPEALLLIKNHRFEPAELKVPAGQRIDFVVHNQDATPEEVREPTA